MKKTVIFLIALFFIVGCKSHYSYSSSLKKEITRVKTDIQTLKFVELYGANIQPVDRWNFKTYLQEALKERTFVTLSSSSPNKLYITATISPIISKKYKDVFFKVDQFHVDKSISMLSNYKVEDENRKTIVSEIYSIDTQTTEVSNNNYNEAERKHLENHSSTKLHKKLMRGLAESVVRDIINERSIK